jgi:hypothetical protein
MVRVYFEYIKNIFVKYPDYFMLVLFLAVFFVSVSVSDVLINISRTEIPSLFNFLVVALQDTNLIIQILIAGFVIRMAILGFKQLRKTVTHVSWIPAKFRY